MLYIESRLHGFRGDVDWRCWRRTTTTTPTDDGRVPAYTISSHMRLRLRWAKNVQFLWNKKLLKGNKNLYAINSSAFKKREKEQSALVLYKCIFQMYTKMCFYGILCFVLEKYALSNIILKTKKYPCDIHRMWLLRKTTQLGRYKNSLQGS